jgi:hypothetical protein
MKWRAATPPPPPAHRSSASLRFREIREKSQVRKIREM